MSIDKEPDTAGIIAKAFNDDKIVLLPYIESESDKIYPVVYTKDMPLKHGKYKIKEPVHPVFYPEKDIDAVIVPAIAFDRYGNRIGYGKGYYDRFLSSLNKNTIKVGFSFNRCVVDEIHSQEWDVPVDIIFTETGTRTKEQII